MQFAQAKSLSLVDDQIACKYVNSHENQKMKPRCGKLSRATIASVWGRRRPRRPRCSRWSRKRAPKQPPKIARETQETRNPARSFRDTPGKRTSRNSGTGSGNSPTQNGEDSRRIVERRLRMNVRSRNAKSMTSKGQVSSILFFYMFNAILTSIIDLICQKISFKKF